MTTSPALQMQNQLANELLQARLFEDWERARCSGRRSVTLHVQKAQRSLFANAFKRLTTEGCREDVLFPCLFVFLNSQQTAMAFPWREDVEPIQNSLAKTRETVQQIMEAPGFQTLKSSERAPSFAAFGDFVLAQHRLFKSMTEYESELQFILKRLPRKNLVRQYGRAVICMYMPVALRRPATSLVEDLLRCFRQLDEESNLARDLKNFQNKHSDFCKHVKEFLSMEHGSERKPVALDWAGFYRTGQL